MSVSSYNGVKYILNYQDRVVHAAIIENKYHRNATACTMLARALARYLGTLSEEIILVPISQSRPRRRERGYNQVCDILTALPTTTSYKIQPLLLVRTKYTESQTHLTKHDRRKNLQGSFACGATPYVTTLKNVTIVIVDDVVTTGATMEAARAALAPHLPPSVTLICLALAH